MYTATIKSKVELEQGLQITVDFTDGVKTITETVIPQDETGLRHWVKARLTSLNSIAELDTKYAVDAVIDLVEPVVEKTQAQIDQDAWLVNYSRLTEVQKLIDLGIIPTDNLKVVALRNKLKTDFKPAYLGLI